MILFYDFAKHKTQLVKQCFEATKRSWWKYLIKPDEFWWIRSPKRRNASRMVKKALGFSVEATGLFAISENLIKPVVYWSFWGPFPKKAFKSIKKALRFPLQVDDVLRLWKTSKTISKTTFWSFQKSWTKYLIKHVVYLSFWDPFPKKALKSIKKALRFSLKVDVVLRLCKTPKNH